MRAKRLLDTRRSLAHREEWQQCRGPHPVAVAALRNPFPRSGRGVGPAVADSANHCRRLREHYPELQLVWPASAAPRVHHVVAHDRGTYTMSYFFGASSYAAYSIFLCATIVLC